MSATIIRDGVKYCSSNQVKKLTYAQYKELENKKLIDNDIIYYITDIDDMNKAHNVSYDGINILSGIENTQDAIVAVNNNIEKCYDLFAIQRFKKDNISLATGKTTSTTLDVTKEGYTPIGILYANTDNASSSGANMSYLRYYAYNINASENTISVNMRNFTSSSTSKTFICLQVLYIKSEYYEHFAPVYNIVT